MSQLVLVLLIVISFALVLFLGIKVIDEEKLSLRASYLTLFMLVLTGFLTTLFISFMNSMNDITPTALDVYRGKTELQVNKIYKNDSILVSCDSVVVMKDNF